MCVWCRRVFAALQGLRIQARGLPRHLDLDDYATLMHASVSFFSTTYYLSPHTGID